MALLADNPHHMARIEKIVQWLKRQVWTWQQSFDVQIALLAGLTDGDGRDKWPIVVARLRELAEDLEDLHRKDTVLGFVRSGDVRSTDRRLDADPDFVAAVKLQFAKWASVPNLGAYVEKWGPTAERAVLVSRRKDDN